jgi:hypothetical protein
LDLSSCNIGLPNLDGLSRKAGALNDANRPISAAMSRHISTPGIEVRQMLTRVNAEVRAAAQTPRLCFEIPRRVRRISDCYRTSRQPAQIHDIRI